MPILSPTNYRRKGLLMYSLHPHNRTLLNLRRRLNQFARLLVLLAAAVAATSVLGSTLTPIPLLTGYSPSFYQSEGRGISPDGKYVAGDNYNIRSYTTNYTQDGLPNSPMDGWGFFYDVGSGYLTRPGSGSVPQYVSGIAYRTVGGQKELLLAGKDSSGWQANWMTTDGGVTWGGKRRSNPWWSFQANTENEPLCNSLAATTNSDLWFCILGDNALYNMSTQRKLWTCVGSNAWPGFFTNAAFEITYGAGNCGNMNAVAATGRAVGWYCDFDNDPVPPDAAWRHNYVVEWPPPVVIPHQGYNYTNTWPFIGLDGMTYRGAAWAITPDGNTIFGHSPTATDNDMHAYKALATAEVESVVTVTALPEFSDAAKSNNVVATPYGCSADGRYAVGSAFRGTQKTQKAVIWDTGDPDSSNWTIVDLTELAAAEGILGNFTKLDRAYGVGVNAAGLPVVTGYGRYFDGNGTTNRAFVMVVLPRPTITSITGAGTSTVTVNYANALAGKTYTLQSSTDLKTWNTVGSKTATASTDFQTENSVASSRRYYRLSFTP
jgi:hypothetical protein